MKAIIRVAGVWLPDRERTLLEFISRRTVGATARDAGRGSLVALPVLRGGRVTAVVARYF